MFRAANRVRLGLSVALPEPARLAWATSIHWPGDSPEYRMPGRRRKTDAAQCEMRVDESIASTCRSLRASPGPRRHALIP